MNDPGEYYEWKRKEAERLQQEISKHRLDDCMGEIGCKTCKKLERELELARYVGD